MGIQFQGVEVLAQELQAKTVQRADVSGLENGELFAPKFVENKLKFFAFIKEAVAFGDDRPFVTALINIDLDAVGGVLFGVAAGGVGDAGVVRGDPDICFVRGVGGDGDEVVEREGLVERSERVESVGA